MIAPVILALAIVGTPHRTVIQDPQYGPGVALVISTSLDANGVCYTFGLSATCYTISEPYCKRRADRFDCVLPTHSRNNPTPVPERRQVTAKATLTTCDTSCHSTESPVVPEAALSCELSTLAGCPCDVIYTPTGSCFPPPPTLGAE